MRFVLLVLILFGAARLASADEPFGRFFFTPAERAQLDTARTQKPRTPPPPAAKPAPAAEAPPAPQVVSYGGLVRRSDGRAMLWINDKLVDDKTALAEGVASGRVDADGAVSLRVQQTGRRIDLKVGQTVEIYSGAISERTERRGAAVAERSKPSPASDRRTAGGKAEGTENTPAERDASSSAPDSAAPHANPGVPSR